MTTEDTDVLAALVSEMDVAVERGDYELWGELNSRLHVSIADYAGMPTLREMGGLAGSGEESNMGDASKVGTETA
jgi:DNA-binding GntR family transcriptional regulator